MYGIATIVPLYETVGREMLHGIGSYKPAEGYWSIKLLNLTEAVFDRVHLLGVDGMIVQADQPQWREALLGLGVPVVDISQRDITPRLPCVRFDNEEIGRVGAAHLLDAGFRSLGFVSRPALQITEARRAGFCEVARRVRVEPAIHETEVYEHAIHVDEEEEYARLRAWVSELPKPAGVMTSKDAIAVEIANVVSSLGLRSPHDVAVVGVHDDEALCRLCHPPISSVRTPAERFGYEAAAMLDRMLHGQDSGSPVVLPPVGVNVRASSDILMIDDPDLEHALRFIREHATEGIQVSDVLDAVSIHRRTLEKRFRDRLGRSPAVEIRRVQLEHAKLLLTETDLPVAEVAERSGFTSPPRLTEAFARETTVTPKRYREQHSRVR